MDPNINIDWLSKGNELFELKRYSNAMFYYENAIKIDQNNKNIWLNKGNELFTLKKYYFQ